MDFDSRFLYSGARQSQLAIMFAFLSIISQELHYVRLPSFSVLRAAWYKALSAESIVLSQFSLCFSTFKSLAQGHLEVAYYLNLSSLLYKIVYR